jgi:hypothetical protein
MAQIRRGLHEFADFVAIFARHGNIGEHENWLHRRQLLDGRDTVRDCLNLETLILENSLGHSLNDRAIVRDEDQSSHTAPLWMLNRHISRQTNITTEGGSQEKQYSGVRIRDSGSWQEF